MLLFVVCVGCYKERNTSAIGMYKGTASILTIFIEFGVVSNEVHQNGIHQAVTDGWLEPLYLIHVDDVL